MSEILFDDVFRVDNVDPDGKKYDKARSEKHDMYMLLDVNTEIYPINKNERFLVALTPSLVLNTKDGSVSIQDKFEYIMHGRLYNITNDGGSKPQLEVAHGKILRGRDNVYAISVIRKLIYFQGGICIIRWASDDAQRGMLPIVLSSQPIRNCFY